jgi:predicted amidohydrolase
MPEGDILKVGIAQIDCALGDLDANEDKHREFIARGRDAGVDLLIFPELSLTGYQIGPETVSAAMRADHPRLTRLAREAGEMMVIAGFVEEGYAAQFFNSAALLHRGEAAFVHRKLNPATYGNLEEGKYFASGRYVETFDLGDTFTGAIMICADLWNPALVHLAALHGTTLLISPVCSALGAVSGDFSNPDGWAATLHFYAMMYGMPVIMANRTGRDGDLVFWGGSSIHDPRGRIVAEAEGDEETLIIGDIDYAQVREARFNLPTVRDSNLALIQREIERLSGLVGVPKAVRKR